MTVFNTTNLWNVQKNAVQDRPDLIQSELAGLAFDSLQQVFRKPDIKIAMSLKPFPLQQNTIVFIIIDPVRYRCMHALPSKLKQAQLLLCPTGRPSPADWGIMRRLRLIVLLLLFLLEVINLIWATFSLPMTIFATKRTFYMTWLSFWLIIFRLFFSGPFSLWAGTGWSWSLTIWPRRHGRLRFRIHGNICAECCYKRRFICRMLLSLFTYWVRQKVRKPISELAVDIFFHCLKRLAYQICLQIQIRPFFLFLGGLLGGFWGGGGGGVGKVLERYWGGLGEVFWNKKTYLKKL